MKETEQHILKYLLNNLENVESRNHKKQKILLSTNIESELIKSMKSLKSSSKGSKIVDDAIKNLVDKEFIKIVGSSSKNHETNIFEDNYQITEKGKNYIIANNEEENKNYILKICNRIMSKDWKNILAFCTVIGSLCAFVIKIFFK